MLSLAQTLKALSQNVKTVKDNLTSIKNQIVTTIKVINVLAKELGIESGLNDNGESNGKTPGSMTQPQNGGVSITNKETKDVVSKLKHVMQRSEAGQIFKSDGAGGMVPSEIFKSVKMAGNSSDLETEKQFTTVELSEIMNEWKRYTHSYGPAIAVLDKTNVPEAVQRQNDWSQSGHTIYLDRTKTGWIVDKKTNMIQSTVDGYPIAGFISPTPSYDNYKFKCKIDTGWDQDNNGIVVGYIVDDKGKEHTLTVMRGLGTWAGKTPTNNPDDAAIDTKFWWGLIYDAGNDTQDILVDMNSIVGSDYNSGSTNYCYITAIREGKKITAKTTRFSTDGSNNKDVDAWTFTYTMPETKPASMPQEEYDNIRKMLSGKNHVGFCVRSSCAAKFSIVEQEGIYTSMKLFDLTTNNHYEFDSNTKQWVNKGDMGTIIPNRTFLYSERSNHLYFYHYKGNYTQIF